MATALTLGCADKSYDLAYLPDSVVSTTSGADNPAQDNNGGAAGSADTNGGAPGGNDADAGAPSASDAGTDGPDPTDASTAAPDANASGSAGVTIAGIDIATLAPIVDQRPLGGAALTGGTSGGGTLEQALADDAVIEVDTAAELIDAVSGDSPTVVLILPGSYDLAEAESYTIETCELACPAGSSRATQTQPARKCVLGEPAGTTLSLMRRLRVGSNKTILGVGAGATIRNARFEFSGSSNIIIRNLELTEVNPQLIGSGEAILMWPAHHVWVDHCTFSKASHAFINIVSNYDQESSTYALTDAASHITISWNSFDGASEASCSGKQKWGIGTQRNPAVTVHHNWLRGSEGGHPYLFGSETWGHVFNNFIEQVSDYGVAVSCGAKGLIEGNVFQASPGALYIGDEGSPSWPFCAVGLFGTAWAPLDDASDPANNLLDDASDLRLANQSLDGATLDLPVESGGHRVVSVPLTTGDETYEYDLEPISNDWARSLAEQTGMGQLF